jgi:alpha-glucosidase (family GH31 glycosyl hydrolase)
MESMAEARTKFPRRPIPNPKTVVSGDKYRFTVLTDGLLRFEYAPDGQFEDRASTFAINRDLGFVPKFDTYEDESAIEIVTDRFHLTYNRGPFSASGLVADVRGKVTASGSQWRFGLDEDEIEGLRNLGGTARTLDGIDGRCNLEKGIVGKAGFAIIDDSDTMLFDENGWVAARRPRGIEKERVDGYLFAYGLDFKEAIKAFYMVSGNQPVVPRWALGNWWSRYYAYNADEYVNLMDRFRKEEVPLSVGVIDMDWHYVHGERVTTPGWTGYTWNKELFPNPRGFCEALHKRGLKISLNDHPADGIHAFEDVYDEMSQALGHNTGQKKPILFNPTNKKFLDVFFDVLHRKLEDDGVDFWWIDWQQGKYSRIPGIDPLWMLNHFHFLDNARGGRRPIIFSRYGGPGSHRYPVGFSGDTRVSWASLDFQPEFTATASNIGYGWWSHDIGGHMKGGKDDELATRWVQFGVFSPIMRLHSTLSEWMSKEPWNYRRECEEIMGEYLRFRHKLIPYLYTMNVRASVDGEPLIQPLYWQYPKDKDAYHNKNQYFFGTDLMVAPITAPRNLQTGMGRVKAWLPPNGRHVDIFVGIIYDGGRMLNLHRQLNDYPVLAREGSVVPLDRAGVPENGGLNATEYEVIVVVGRDGKFTIVEDIGDDPEDVNTKRQAYKQRQIPITWTQAEGCLRIGPVKSEVNDATETNSNRGWKIRFISCRGVKLEDIDTSGFDAETGIDKSMAGGCTVTVGNIPLGKELAIKIGKNPQLDVLDIREVVRSMVNGFQCSYDIKDKVYECIKAEGLAMSARASRLLALGVDEQLIGPVFELLLADSRLEYTPQFDPCRAKGQGKG